MKLKSYSPLFEVYTDSLFLRALVCIRLPVTDPSVIPVLDGESWEYVLGLIPGLGSMKRQLECGGLAVCLCRVPLSFTSSVRVEFDSENQFHMELNEGELWKLIFIKQ